MPEQWTAWRNAALGAGYRHLLKPLFFAHDPERVHDFMTGQGIRLGRTSFGRRLTGLAFSYDHPALQQTVAGIRFNRPIGLSAGFDKEGALVDIMPQVGFGFMEVGSVSGTPAPGNAKPRLWRLKRSKSLVVHFGLNSTGADNVARRLADRHFRFPVGISIVKANLPIFDDESAGIGDYVKAATALQSVGDYWAINISCPNTTGGEPFTDPGALDRLLTALHPYISRRPTFIKLPADIALDRIDALIDVARRHPITGFICTNLTTNRRNPAIRDANVPPHGGLSGLVVREIADDVLRHVRRTAGSRFILIGSGGIFTVEDAYRKIRLGASLLEMITGMIYQGPQVVSSIHQGLVRLLHRDGFANISQAVGIDVY